MVKERVLAVPDTSIFIAELPEATRNIIRKGRKSGKVGLSIGELFENFVADLICGTHTNGSDERMYIKQWFDRCYFSIMPEETFLSYLLEMREIDSVLECWEILQELKEMEEPDWRYSRTLWKNIFRNIEPIQENRQKTSWKLIWKRCWNGIKEESICWREMFQRSL